MAAEDTYPGCSDAQLRTTGGSAQGTFDVVTDKDAMKFRVERGDVLTFRVHPEQEIELYPFRRDTGATFPVTELNGSSYIFPAGTETVSKFRMRSDGIVCFKFHTNAEPEDLPFRWRMTFGINNPSLPPIEPASEKLQQRVETLETRVSDLRSELETKERRIEELQTRVNRLQNETRDVSIQVEVAPSGDSQQFVEGGRARVTAKSDGADVSKLSVSMGGESYRLGSDGTVAVPLEASGTREMTLAYGRTTERLSLEVAPASGSTAAGSGDATGTNDADGDGVADADDYAPNDPAVQEKSDLTGGETTSDSGPGFGPVVGLLASFSGVVFLWRRSE